MNKHLKYVIIPLILVVAAAFLIWDQGITNQDQGQAQNPTDPNQTLVEKGENNMTNPVVTIEMENGNIIKLELYPEVAPNTVNNFISLVQQGFYDGTIFHRVIPGFMIQGGDPDGTGMGGPGYSIKGEFKGNGFDNELKHTRGVISMARSQHPDSAGSQFFIMVADAPHLDRQYAGFGKVIDGIEEVDRIVKVDRNRSDRPNEEQKMKKVTVDTHGVEYPEPEKVQGR